MVETTKHQINQQSLRIYVVYDYEHDKTVDFDPMMTHDLIRDTVHLTFQSLT